MSIPRIQHVPFSNISQAAQLSIAGFRDNETFRVVFPNSDSEVSIAHEATRIRQEIAEDAGNPHRTRWHLCIEVADGSILCYANYYVYTDSHETQTQQLSEGGFAVAGRTAPPDANQEAWNFVAPRTAAARKAAMGDDKTSLYLATLCTADSARRRGYGTLMLKWGKAKAKELDMPLMLQASPHAVSMYAKSGLKQIGEARKDLTKWGGPVTVDVIMRWDAGI